MAGLGDTTAALARRRRALAEAAAATRRPGPVKLTEVHDFGPNPGALRMLTYAPPGLAAPPLVVTLHGCVQSAEDFAHGAGWLTLAERYGFVVLSPEQTSANNPNRCYNWFEPGDTRRDGGEAASIRQMIAHAVERYGVDVSRIYVTGLSAGGAMTSAMLATYPEVFAGGAVVAGLPYGGAANLQQAFAAMSQSPSRPAAEWAGLVRRASDHAGPWPQVSVWHGDADATVSAANAEEIVKQWREVHGLSRMPADHDRVDGCPRQVWRDPDGRPQVLSYTVSGMGHGAPLATRGAEGVGQIGPFMLEVGVSCAYQIARDWGLAAPAAARPVPSPEPQRPAGGFDIETIIRSAFAAAGLTR